MKIIRIITLVLIVLLLIAGMLLSSGGLRQATAAPLESGGFQMVDEMEIEVPEWGPVPLDGDWGGGQDCVAWNS